MLVRMIKDALDDIIVWQQRFWDDDEDDIVDHACISKVRIKPPMLGHLKFGSDDDDVGDADDEYVDRNDEALESNQPGDAWMAF